MCVMLTSVASQHALHQISQWTKPFGLFSTFFVGQTELLYEQDVMLEARVQMCLEPQPSHDTVVVAVNMCVNAIQALEDGSDRGLEAARKRHAGLRGEDVGIAEVVARPCQKMRNVRRRWETGGLGEGRGIVPQVFELVRGLHFWTGCGRAEFRDGSVEQIDLVVKVDDWK